MRVSSERRASSLAAHSWRQVGRTCGFEKLLQAVDERECVTQGAAKYDLRRRDVAVRVRGVAQLQHGTQEAVMVQAACRASVRHQKTFRSLNRHLCSAIGLRKVDRGHTMSDTPEAKEGLYGTSGELWSAVAGKLFRNTKRGEEGTEVADEASSAGKGVACGRPKHLYPA